VSHPQLPLPLRFPPEQRFDRFIGALAECAALAELARGERGEPVLLSGPAGSGKTHLLLAAGAEADQAARRVAYLPLMSLAGNLGEAIEGRELADLVCVDGLEWIVGRREDEIALFDLHNRVRSAGAGLLYAARDTPANLGLVLPDLLSRLSQCVQLQVPAPDEARRRLILQQRAAGRGLELDEAALDYLFSRVGRDLTGLLALLDRIDRASLAARRRITVPFLRSLLSDQPPLA
jgi:DnaA-homolog protein